LKEGVDFILGETFGFIGEALLALKAIKEVGLPAIINISNNHDGLT